MRQPLFGAPTGSLSIIKNVGNEGSYRGFAPCADIEITTAMQSE